MSHRLPARVRLAAALSLTLALSGCGYSLVGRGSTLPATVRVIRFETLANETSRVAVEQRVSREIARELATRGRFEVRADSRDADAELYGAVTQFDLYPVAFDEQGRAREYQVAVTARVTFRTVPDEKVLWENPSYTFRDNYSLPLGAASYADRENEAIDRVAERFAASLVSSVLEGF
ncbi:MAG: LPS assembly lipoprotein LptE [Acidobacteriota bacterium]|nr:LPS assembly lipoprotein LptE [Acidobacteriota bacterium]